MNDASPAARRADARTPLRHAHRPAPEPLAMTLKDAALASGLSPATLRRRAREGRLRLFRVGGRCLVDATSLRALLGLA